jgi:hypothetical protein
MFAHIARTGRRVGRLVKQRYVLRRAEFRAQLRAYLGLNVPPAAEANGLAGPVTVLTFRTTVVDENGTNPRVSLKLSRSPRL